MEQAHEAVLQHRQWFCSTDLVFGTNCTGQKLIQSLPATRVQLSFTPIEEGSRIPQLGLHIGPKEAGTDCQYVLETEKPQAGQGLWLGRPS